MIKKKPIIGITLDWSNTDIYSKHCPWYALRENYIEVIAKYGGVPITIPYIESAIKDYIDLIDGLIITGGDYDIDPSFYQENASSNLRLLKNNRVIFEKKLFEGAIAKQIPILGICAGQQLMAVINGGKLIQDIPTEVGDKVIHEQSILNLPHDQPIHKIEIVKGSLLHKITNITEMMVNSTHHQAVKSVSDKMTVTAKASDGVIEAIELKNYPFCLGVEWHPEYEISAADSAIFKALINIAEND